MPDDRPQEAMTRRMAGLVLALGLGWIALEFVALGPFSYLKMSDMADHQLTVLLASALEPWTFPDWFPYLAGGNDRRALGIVGPLEQILFDIFPGWIANLLLTAGQIPLAGIFTYLLARQRLRLSREAAVLAAVCFVWGFFTGRLLTNAIAVVPLLIWALGKCFDARTGKSRLGYFGVAAIAPALLSQAHLLYPWPYATAALWFVVVDTRWRVRDWAILSAAALVAFAIRLPDLIAMSAYSPLSVRSFQYNPLETSIRLGAHDPFFLPLAARLDMLRRDLLSTITTIAPWTFLAPVAIVGAWRSSSFRKVLAFAVTVFAASFVLILLKFAIIDVLPQVRGVRADRLTNATSLPLALLGAFGVDVLSRWLRGAGSHRSLPAILVNRGAMLVAVALFIGISLIGKAERAEAWLRDGSYKRNFGSPVLRELADQTLSERAPFRVASFQMHGAVANGYGFETADGKYTLGLNRYRLFWGQVTAPYLERDDYKRELFWATSGGGVLSLFSDEAAATVDFASDYRIHLLSLVGTRYIFSRDRLVAPGLREIRSSDVAWNDLTDMQKARVALRENFEGRTLLYIYENVNALPRAFVVGSATVLPTSDALFDRLGESTLDELTDAVLFSQQDVGNQGFDDLGGSGSATFEEYGADHLRLLVSTDGPAILVITNTFVPYWSCTVDGEATPLLAAYGTFWSVRVPSGNSEVACRYTAPYRNIGQEH